MIRIKDCIFNENKILKIEENNQENKLIVYYDTNNHDKVLRYIENATFEDIEWNYEDEQIRKCLDSVYREEELEEENRILKELNVCVGCNNNPDYKSRIDKAIEYIIERYDYKGHALTHTFDKDNVKELLKILEGEKNE